MSKTGIVIAAAVAICATAAFAQQAPAKTSIQAIEEYRAMLRESL